MQQRMIQHILSKLAAVDGFPPVAKGVQCQLETFISKGLDEVIRNTQTHKCLNGRSIVGRGDHNNIRIHALSPEGTQQLQAAHLGHVHIQDDQIHRITSQPEKGRVCSGKGADYLKAGVLLYIALVQLRNDGVIFDNDSAIQSNHLLSLRVGIGR